MATIPQPPNPLMALVREASLLREARTAAMQQGQGFLCLLPGELDWLQRAYEVGEGAPHAWVVRHPTLIVALLEAYPEIRQVYPTERLQLTRQRFSFDDDDDNTEEMDILDETFEAKPPDILVLREWFPEPVPDTPGKDLPGGMWMLADEEDCGPVGKLMHQEADRLNTVLGEQAHWRAEWWWSRRGPTGGWVVIFTPYGNIDFVLSDLVSNRELDQWIAREQAEMAKPSETIEIEGEEPFVYQPGDQDYLEALINERMRRESLGIFYPPLYDGPPLSAEETQHYEQVVAAIEDEDMDPVLKRSLEQEGERLHAARLAMLRKLRDDRRAMKLL